VGAASRIGGLLERAGYALIALGALVAACGDRGGGGAYTVPGARGERITVEVLNATAKSGLARAGTRLLRRAGIDVVAFGNAPAGTPALDATRLVVRRGTTAAAERVQRALGVGRIVVERDSARLLDVSVLLGADFAPRLEFHP
jgi:hypothetical protein